MIPPVVFDFLKDNAAKIVSIAVIVVSLTAVYFNFKHTICEECTMAERSAWQLRDAETRAASDAVLQSVRESNAKELAEQNEINREIILHHEKIIDELKVAANRIPDKLYINVASKSKTCSTRGETNTEVSQGGNGQGPTIERAEIESGTAEHIRQELRILKLKEAIFDEMFAFIDQNNLAEK